eukprot:scaffold23028_cov71-Phaeocystis_antarctica.AAC.3
MAQCEADVTCCCSVNSQYVEAFVAVYASCALRASTTALPLRKSEPPFLHRVAFTGSLSSGRFSPGRFHRVGFTGSVSPGRFHRVGFTGSVSQGLYA